MKKAIEVARKVRIDVAPSAFWKQLAKKVDPTLKDGSILPTDHRAHPDTRKIYCGACQKSKPLFEEIDGLLVVNK